MRSLNLLSSFRRNKRHDLGLDYRSYWVNDADWNVRVSVAYQLLP